MKRWIRAWGATALAWGLVLGIGGAAIAGAGSHPNPSSHTAAVSASESEGPDTDATESEKPEASESPEAQGGNTDTHGACVSHWVHEAGDQDLKGADFGAFVSSVARSDETGADCDFSQALSDAKAAAPRTHGHKGEHGKSAEHAHTGS